MFYLETWNLGKLGFGFTVILDVLTVTQSSSAVNPGTITFTSLDFAVVIEAFSASLLRYSWQPVVLSTDIVGADP